MRRITKGEYTAENEGVGVRFPTLAVQPVGYARHEQQLEAVRWVSEEITRELDLTTLLTLIDRRAAELVGVRTGAIHCPPPLP